MDSEHNDQEPSFAVRVHWGNENVLELVVMVIYIYSMAWSYTHQKKKKLKKMKIPQAFS